MGKDLGIPDGALPLRIVVEGGTVVAVKDSNDNELTQDCYVVEERT